MSRKFPEILTGLVIIIIAAGFLFYALSRAQALSGAGYPLTAQFSDIGGLTVGSDVKLGGVVVGHVTDEHLDPQTYAAIVKLQINNGIQLPSDTSAAISSDGLLGGNYVGLSPGGSNTMLAPGQSFPVTQSAINIENLLGKFIFSMGGMDKSSGGQSSGNSAPAKPGAISNPAALPNPASGAPAQGTQK
jgi:phospholipid/cholesterol/gamma-HCH transport system substrate-binding protein